MKAYQIAGYAAAALTLSVFAWIVVYRALRRRMIEKIAMQIREEENTLGPLETTTGTIPHALLERLKVSEKRYELALDATSDGLWDWNIKDNVSYCSPTYFRMLGYEPDELSESPHEHWVDLLHPEDKEYVVRTTRQELETVGGYEIEFRMRAKDGRYKWILSRGKVVARDENGHPCRAVGTHTDLTARKQLELELRTANEEQHAIFEAAPVGIVFIKDRVILRCNRKLEEIFGYGPGELMGRTTRCWYPDETAYADMGHAVAQDLAAYGIHHTERRLVRRDGSLFWARMTAQLIDPSHVSKGLVGMLEDITEAREASDTLRKAKEAAEAATRAKSEFLANMSHEIRTPMNAVLGFMHLLQRDPLTPRQLTQLGRMSKAARHLLGILNDILDFSQIEASKISLQTRDFEPARVMDQVCGIVANKVAEKGLELLVDLSRVPPVLHGDDARLGQVLLNIVENAVKFTETGRISIVLRSIDQGPGRIVLRLEVRDTGIGMTEEQVERIFKAFEQADGSMTRRYGGTGLGLAISKRLVELMGGCIGVKSEIGRGTTIWMEVPFETSSQSPQHAMHIESPQGTGVCESIPIPASSGKASHEERDKGLQAALEGIEEPNASQVADTLADLESLLTADDVSAGDLFERSKSLLMDTLGDDARQLGRHIENFDYDEALKTLRAARLTGRLRGESHGS